MTTKKTRSTFDRLSKKLGRPTFGSHLIAIIETDFTSRSECARHLEVTPQTLNDYLTGRRIPSPELAGKMADKLGYSPLSFIELSLSDSVRKAGYQYRVRLESA